jgi:transposase-like protein
MKKSHPPELKAKLVIEALQEIKTVNQIASEHNIHPNLLSRWKTEAVNGLAQVFRKETAEVDKVRQAYELKIDELYTQIGKLSTEVDWLKKKSGR